MPSKSQRAASRQAKLRDNKKRGKGSAQVFDAGPTAADIAARESAAAESDERQPAPTRAAVASRPTRRAAQPGRAEADPSYSYLGAELRRIAAVSLIIFVILAAASFVLGG